MATYIAQFNEYTHKVQTLKVSSNFKVATALATAGDYKRIYDLLSIMFDYKAIENLKLDKGVILPDGHCHESSSTYVYRLPEQSGRIGAKVYELEIWHHLSVGKVN